MAVIWLILILLFVRSEYRRSVRRVQQARTRELIRQLRIRKRSLLINSLLGEYRRPLATDQPYAVITERREVTERKILLTGDKRYLSPYDQ